MANLISCHQCLGSGFFFLNKGWIASVFHIPMSLLKQCSLTLYQSWWHIHKPRYLEPACHLLPHVPIQHRGKAQPEKVWVGRGWGGVGGRSMLALLDNFIFLGINGIKSYCASYPLYTTSAFLWENELTRHIAYIYTHACIDAKMMFVCDSRNTNDY